MTRVLPVLLLASCAVYDGPDCTAAPTVGIDTLHTRWLTIAGAGDLLWEPELRPAWRAPNDREASTIAQLVPELLQAAQTQTIDPEALAAANAIGMQIELWEVARSEQLVLYELPDHRHGAGAYLFSVTHLVSGAPWVLLQAPHADYDQHTGEIAASLFFTPPSGGAPAAFFTSTLHRYTQADGTRARRANNPADPCHDAAHLFNVATRAAAETFPEATVIQLHGFSETDDGTHGTDANRPPEGSIIVVSAGSKDGPTALSAAADMRLGNVLGSGVKLYPTESGGLGATTNVEMFALQAVPGARFLHVEMAAGLRDRLMLEPAQRYMFGGELLSVATDPQL